MLNQRSGFMVILSSAIFGAAFLAYAYMITPLYKSTGSIMVFRNQIEFPDAAQEYLKNRWVWVRDGLSLREALTSDEFLLEIIRNEPIFAERAKIAKGGEPNESELKVIGALKKKISVEYTGGDVFSYIFTVEDPSPIIAKYLVTALMERVRQLSTIKILQAYEESDQLLKKRLKIVDKNGEEASYLQTTINKINTSKILFEAGSKERVQVLTYPITAEKPFWPKHVLLLIVGAILGASLGLGYEFIRLHLKQNVPQ